MTDALSPLISALRQSIDQMPPQLQAAAKYVIDHPGDFGLDPIRTTATKIGVSSNVLVRLAQRMGFDSYNALRKPFRHALVTDGETRLDRDWLNEVRTDASFDTAQAGFARNEMNVVARSLRLMDPEKTSAVIQLILNANRCFITATRASYALAHYFHYAGRMAHPGLQLIPRHMGSATDDLLDAGPNDCLLAITVRPYSSEAIRTMRFAADRGLKIILISDSDMIAPGIRPDLSLQISTRSMHHFSSFSGAMAVLECLLSHLFAAGGENALRRVEAYEKTREDTGAYWQPAKLPKVRKT
ncbi:MurR/RpiR family transcriptional regulator [Ruegeria profundi]|uniref:MurR/RpiR family transcriptional regulator n=1 Tax=Ruegeria profundi TaxID=1685378 RepID=UPI003C7C3346